MSGSGSKIDYNTRPAKSIERKIILNTLKELSPLRVLSNYQYIGFGAVSFVDFKMIHKELGINNMTSIECDNGNRNRYIYNKPYSCIDLKWGMSTEILPHLNFDPPSIVWLDYDGILEDYMFEDIQTLSSKLKKGSMFIFTCNSLLSDYKDLETGVAKFEEDFKNEDLSFVRIDNKLLRPKFSPVLIQKMINSRIKSVLKDRNSGLPDEEKIEYQQLFFFEYKDGVEMVSFGGIFESLKNIELIKNITFTCQQLLKYDDVPYKIDIPILTKKELQAINCKLPNERKSMINEFKKKNIPISQLEKYAELYRFYPQFDEVLVG